MIEGFVEPKTSGFTQNTGCFPKGVLDCRRSTKDPRPSLRVCEGKGPPLEPRFSRSSPGPGGHPPSGASEGRTETGHPRAPSPRYVLRSMGGVRVDRRRVAGLTASTGPPGTTTDVSVPRTRPRVGGVTRGRRGEDRRRTRRSRSGQPVPCPTPCESRSEDFIVFPDRGRGTVRAPIVCRPHPTTSQGSEGGRNGVEGRRCYWTMYK